MKSLTALNHLEISALVDTLKPILEGARIERLFIPTRATAPDGFIKGEFVFQLRSKKDSQLLLWFQLRPQHAVFWTTSGQKIPVAPDSTQSHFHQYLSKELRGERIQNLRSFPMDRVVEFRFSQDQVLVLILIPARPEAIFGKRKDSTTVEVFVSTQKNRAPGTVWTNPVPNSNLPEFSVREIFESQGLGNAIESQLRNEGQLLRFRKVAQMIRQQAVEQQKRKADALRAIKTAENDNPYQYWGEILKSHLGDGLNLEKSGWLLENYSTGEFVQIPCDLSLSLSAQVERFFHLARRRERRLADAYERLKEANSKLKFYEGFKLTEAEVIAGASDQGLLEWERNLGISVKDGVQRKTDRKIGLGREFLSQDGYVIIAGRNVNENLDLTFKKAKGNDVWLHVRGKRSAHVVVCVPPGKSAPLSTLLDAAQICMVVSGGREWGKTEVDYTFRKNVKRIKNSTEVSYTQNKTLLVQPDSKSIDRLFSSEEKE